jgi:hypothetical protein
MSGEHAVSNDWHTEEFPPQSLRRHRLEADRNGNMVIPARLLAELDVRPHEVLLAHRDGEERRLEKLDAALAKAQDYFHSRVTTDYLSDQLIADRRVEALRELWE